MDEITNPSAEAAAPKPEEKVQPTVEERADRAVLEPDAEREGQVAEREAVPVEAHELTVPDFLSLSEQTPERMEYVTGFGRVAAESGIGRETAQSMLEAAIDFAVAIPYTPADDYTTHADARGELEKAFGPEIAADIVTKAVKYTSTRPALAEFLDETGLGNDVAVLGALAYAQSGWLGTTPAQAEAEIQRVIQNPKGNYFSSDAKKRLPAVTAVQILSRVAHRDESLPVPSTKPAPTPSAANDRAMRAELAKLAGQKSMSAADAARWTELVSKL